LEYLDENEIDIIFIDINLPKLKGIDFIKMVPVSAKFIITTAYHEYALEGYELNVVDYLLKPVEFNRFLMAVKKAAEIEKKYLSRLPAEKKEGNDFMYINMNKRRVKVNFSEILFIEGMKEYVKIHISKEKWLMTKLQIGQIQELLNEEFIRIHRSYIVAKKKVTSYNHMEVSIGNIVLPVGTNYKDSISGELEG
jgi:DNA-binding LytR/AlgR family response regulator